MTTLPSPLAQPSPLFSGQAQPEEQQSGKGSWTDKLTLSCLFPWDRQRGQSQVNNAPWVEGGRRDRGREEPWGS